MWASLYHRFIDRLHVGEAIVQHSKRALRENRRRLSHKVWVVLRLALALGMHLPIGLYFTLTLVSNFHRRMILLEILKILGSTKSLARQTRCGGFMHAHNVHIVQSHHVHVYLQGGIQGGLESINFTSSARTYGIGSW